jgi:hypothetical protein
MQLVEGSVLGFVPFPHQVTQSGQPLRLPTVSHIFEHSVNCSVKKKIWRNPTLWGTTHFSTTSCGNLRETKNLWKT